MSDSEERPPNRPILEIELDPPYTGWIAECDADPPWSLFSSLDSGSVDRLSAALVGRYEPVPEPADAGEDEDFSAEVVHVPGLVVSWNFQDRFGNPVEPTPEGLDRVPTIAVRGLIRAYAAAFRALPNAPTASSSRSSSMRGGQRMSAKARGRRSTS